MGDWGNATARVIRLRRNRFVEFEFRIDDDLEVELVMPYPEFQEFCRRHDVALLPAEEEVALAYQELARQHEDQCR
jgi:phenol/toluene 2-monooxygenase (NADH) P0/A0